MARHRDPMRDLDGERAEPLDYNQLLWAAVIVCVCLFGFSYGVTLAWRWLTTFLGGLF
jgi:hypothetical protein